MEQYQTRVLRYREDTLLQKLIYLYLLENDYSSYKKVKRVCKIDSPDLAYANVRCLALSELIHPHPLLIVPNATKVDEVRARGLSLVVNDRSKRALYWSLQLEYKTLEELPMLNDMSYVRLIRRLATENAEELENWKTISEMVIAL